MEKERVVAEAAGVTPREPAFRDAPPSVSQPQPQQQQHQQSQPPSHGHSRVSSMSAPEHQHGQAYRLPADVDFGQIISRIEHLERLEQQVSFNYGMITKHEAEIERFSNALGRVAQQADQLTVAVEELRSGRVPPRQLDPGRYDPADVEVLANQIAHVTTKANEIENLKVTVELMKQRMRRFEGLGATPAPQTESAASRPDQHYEAIRSQQAQQSQQPPAHSLPLNRPGAALSSEHGRAPGHASAPVLESQPAPGHHTAHERQSNATEQAQLAARQPGFRPAEPLPGPAALSGWRSADSYPAAGGPQVAHGHPLRSHPTEGEAPAASGWAAVNQAPKRSLDEHHPHHETSQPGSPKRPKLAPLKPRSSFGEEQQHQSPYAQAAHLDAAHHARGHAQPADIVMQGQPHPAQVPGPTTNSYRFITSTGQPDSQEHWRHVEGDPNASARYEHTTTGRGRGRGSRGGRRGGRGRGNRSSSGGADAAPTVPEAQHQEHAHGMHAPPEWREHQWAATQQATTNGHYPGQHAYSPVDGARPPPADIAAHTVAVQHGLPYPAGHEHEFPATPVASNADPYALAADLDSANKKTRTKPIRNSDGVLIRKDGRPDMRSVSSANNLRKVHAKKEAEKAEMEGRTPTSGRSLAPAERSSLSDDEGVEEGDYTDHDGDLERGRDSEGRRTSTPATHQDAESEPIMRHRELMSRMFSDVAPAKGKAEQWFPRDEGPPLGVKSEEHENKEREARWRAVDVPAPVKTAQPELERETSQRASEQASREQTSAEGTPNNVRAPEPAVPVQAEQIEKEKEVNTPVDKVSEPAAVGGEKADSKKDSTQFESNGEERAGNRGTPVDGEAAA